MMIHQGRVALVTGGASGIGLAVTRMLAAAGAKVFICGRTGDRLALAAAELRAQGFDVDAAACDVTSTELEPARGA